jgi:hypothetical protein
MSNLTENTENAKTGNRCGYQRGRFRLWTTDNGWAALPFLRLAQRAVVKITETDDPWFFAGRRRVRRADELGELHDRLPRGERRESMCMVGQFLLSFMQVKNMRLLQFESGTGVSVWKIAHRTGLSVSRVKGALADLSSCGFLGSYQPREKLGKDAFGKDTFRGRVAVRWVNSRFLKLLGIWRAFCRMRKAMGMPPPKDAAADNQATGFISRIHRDTFRRPRLV